MIEFGEKLGVHPSVIGLWEAGKRAIPAKRVAAMEVLLGGPLVWNRERYLIPCADGRCGRCHSCTRKRMWARGHMAHRKAGARADGWPPEQEERLRLLAGTMDRHSIAQVLSREFPLQPRTFVAVSIRATRLGISLWPPGRSIKEIAAMLGVSPMRVQAWIDLGWLETFPYETKPGPCQTRVRVHDEALEYFIRRHADHFDARRVNGTSPVAELARVCASRCVPVRFSKPHPRRRRPSNVFGIVCPKCECITFDRSGRPTACRSCGESIEGAAA